MKVTKFLEKTRSRVEIYIDDEYKFWLTKNEIKKLGLYEDMEMSIQKMNNILESIIVKKAKSKAILVLKHSNKTEWELRQKLKKENYIDEVIDKAIEYLVKYEYVNDEKYAIEYAENRKKSRSLSYIEKKLKEKRIDAQIVSRIINNVEVDEEKVIQQLINDSVDESNDMNKDSYQKLYGSLVKKGFNPTLVMKVIKNYQ